MAGPVLDDTLSIDPSRADAELAGTGYRFVRALARSEGGVVWEVEHVNLAVRHVMKLLAAQLSDDPRLLDRFRVEAQVMARLEHDNLLRVTDFGWSAAGRPYLVSELLAGRTLAELLAERRSLPVGPAIELVGQALAGLGEAHRAGLVHRDVTAANLFLCDTNADGERLLKVMDFGLAKVLAPGGQVPSFAPVLSTVPGRDKLPRAALSPEQAEGRGVDARTDLYGVGLVLYELVAGRGPFVAATEAELALAHARASPPPPSSVASQPIAAELDAIVLKALAKDPAARYGTAEEMAAALDRHASELVRSGAGPSGRPTAPMAVARAGEADAGARGAAQPRSVPVAAGRSAVASLPLPVPDRAIFRPGSCCGGDRYRIVDLISFGGFAEIYSARDRRDDAPRAIKVLQARHQSNERAMGQLLREARAGISLAHPNLVRIFDAGIDLPSGALYVAMELLEGHTLRELLRVHRRLDPLVALEWAAELADAVHVLNELGIIHRDLKPENIFVGNDGVLKVLDLGNVRIERVGLKTTCGPVTGTALYMSPEHIRGDKVDRRADVYALALITYECLAGVHPLLVGATVMPSMMEVTSWQLLKEIEPVTKLLPELPAALWRALDRGLRKEREERLSSAAELAAQLRSVQEAMATARGARARLPMMTVAVVRSTGAHEAAKAAGPAVAVPPLGAPGAPWPAPALPEAAASPAAAPGLAPRAVPEPAAARWAPEPPVAPAAQLTPVPVGALPRRAAAPPRWFVPLLAAVAFTVALVGTLWLRRPVDGATEPRADTRSTGEDAKVEPLATDSDARAVGAGPGGGAPVAAEAPGTASAPPQISAEPGPGGAAPALEASAGAVSSPTERPRAPAAPSLAATHAPASSPSRAATSGSRGAGPEKPKPLFE